jgi:hypothetical protein
MILGVAALSWSTNVQVDMRKMRLGSKYRVQRGQRAAYISSGRKLRRF